MLKSLLSVLIFLAPSFLLGQESPCVIRHVLPAGEVGVIEKVTDLCEQVHITGINPTDSTVLINKLKSKNISLRMPPPLNNLSIEINCETTCVFKSPIINSGHMGGTFSMEYDPQMWTAKYYANMYIDPLTSKYVLSPSQEFVVAKDFGAATLVEYFGASAFSYEVKSKEGYPLVSVACEELIFMATSGPLCRILF